MDSDFVLANLIKFMEFGSIEQGWVGHNPAKWANDVLSDSDVYKRVPTKQLTRGDLYTYCLSKSNGNIETAVAIFSWGGMRRDHGRRILVSARKSASCPVSL
jgi:hypothetical protein